MSCNSPGITSSSEVSEWFTFSWSIPNPFGLYLIARPSNLQVTSLNIQLVTRWSHCLPFAITCSEPWATLQEIWSESLGKPKNTDGPLTTLLIWIYQHRCSVHCECLPSTKPRKAEVVLNQLLKTTTKKKADLYFQVEALLYTCGGNNLPYEKKSFGPGLFWQRG